jgi:hypothetical protein
MKKYQEFVNEDLENIASTPIITLQQFVDSINSSPSKNEIIPYLNQSLQTGEAQPAQAQPAQAQTQVQPADTAQAQVQPDMSVTATVTNSAQAEKHAAQPEAQVNPVAAKKPAVKVA